MYVQQALEKFIFIMESTWRDLAVWLLPQMKAPTSLPSNAVWGLQLMHNKSRSALALSQSSLKESAKFAGVMLRLERGLILS